jgi:mono/diheme cytochrome c family protein
MTANIITVIALVAGIAWLGMLFVSAIRNRGSEEVAPNLRPGIDDETVETRRLEGGQKAAIAFSAFLAISLPLYFLTEQQRQEGFVAEFAQGSIERGEHLVAEFGCFNCHGPEGSGGVAPYVEKRSGIAVEWAVPSLNDVFFRYDEEEVNYWVTYGRGNTPMPPWGVPGGGPLNDQQVEDVVNYLATIQVTQDENLAEVDPGIDSALDRLANADATVEAAILDQHQVVAQIQSAPDDVDLVVPLATEARDVLDEAGSGIDTDADGISDAAETELSAISAEAVEGFRIMEPIALDPETADAELADDALAALELASETDPIVTTNIGAIEIAIEEGTVDPAIGLSSESLTTLEETRAAAEEAGIEVAGPIEDLDGANALVAALDAAAAAEEPVEGAADLAAEATTAIEDGSDPDGDGLPTGAENDINGQIEAAVTATTPPEIIPVTLDPTNPASVGGEPDAETANILVGNLETLVTTLSVTEQNQDALLETAEGGRAYLEESQQAQLFSIEFAGVAEAMASSPEEAERAVGLFNSNCARCHTAGYSAGVPYTQEAGSGGFGPALWDGRPTVQFGDANEDPAQDLLVQFLIRGSEAETPYGLNGFGTGRMPAFGASLSMEDIELLARYLRGGNMDGKGTTVVLP